MLRRESLTVSSLIRGPAIIDEWTMTTVVPPGWRASCDGYGNIVLEPV